MGEKPTVICRIAMESPADVVVNSSLSHFLQCPSCHFKSHFLACAGMVTEQEVEIDGSRKFGCSSKASPSGTIVGSVPFIGAVKKFLLQFQVAVSLNIAERLS